ncbi:restriction endonuclease subunit S [Pseudomonas sp. Au-Pse12]|uniref:restriction endonuclease subunit S n=1 Tax=Pseudomonas sp. Au-Pse12 TaxID=2906459 RepID=UPI001E3CB0DF|nr:restriction endonuclease subunit S [Pseudomonas sp. Au-Pse12]MCE4056141.1 restriction endonuclease subunit S [Pseudomonas sp. Au-Pse12]
MSRVFPAHWNVLQFSDAIKDATSEYSKLQKSEYLEHGSFPIVDQGQQQFGGYTNNKSVISVGSCPAIVFGDHTRIFKFVDEPFCLGADGAKVLEPKVELDKKFLFYYLSSLNIESAGYSRHFKFLKKNMIPVPSLSEQKRIAAILDKADAICRKRQQAIQLADDFLRAVFLDMFGELVTSSGYRNAHKYKLQELADYIDYRGKTPEKSEHGVPLITAKNVKKGFVDDEPREYIPEENYDAWMTRGFPKKNDILFTTEAPLGNVALLGEYKKVSIGQRLIALRSKGKVTHEYLMFLLLHPFVQNLIYARSSGSTVKGIRTKELYAIELPVPDMQKQEEFSAIYWKNISLKTNQESARQLEILKFSSLVQKAFSGML